MYQSNGFDNALCTSDVRYVICGMRTRDEAPCVGVLVLAVGQRGPQRDELLLVPAIAITKHTDVRTTYAHAVTKHTATPESNRRTTSRHPLGIFEPKAESSVYMLNLYIQSIWICMHGHRAYRASLPVHQMRKFSTSTSAFLSLFQLPDTCAPHIMDKTIRATFFCFKHTKAYLSKLSSGVSCEGRALHFDVHLTTLLAKLSQIFPSIFYRIEKDCGTSRW